MGERVAEVRCCGAFADVVLVGDGWVAVSELFAGGIERDLVREEGADRASKGVQRRPVELALELGSGADGPLDCVAESGAHVRG